MHRLNSSNFNAVKAFIDECLEQEKIHPNSIKNRFIEFYMNAEGQAVAPEPYKDAPFIQYFIGWKAGYIKAVKLHNQNKALKNLLQSSNLLDVEQGLMLMEHLFGIEPQRIKDLIGNINTIGAHVQVSDWLFRKPYGVLVCVRSLAGPLGSTRIG